MSYNIAIDGPAGAGKSTIAKKVAKEKGYIYVDTGAMYRAMALYMIEKKVELTDTSAIAEMCKNADISIRYEDGVQCVYLNGTNVNDRIRTPEVSAAASKTSVVPEVRVKLVQLQQELAARENVVMDGRDICTKVLPNADVKVFLTASVEVRAKRRYDELCAKGTECDLKEIEKEIAERDHRDMTRAESPLVQADDAVLVDSSYMSIDEVAEKILSLCK
ncbi:cytidylate kinase [Lachnospiraceae bacterium KH1T2]|nr:cytidylate kinase [Lachnospiraceae bacterium KH1T2]